MSSKGTKTGKSSVTKKQSPKFGTDSKGKVVTQSKDSKGNTWYSSKNNVDNYNKKSKQSSKSNTKSQCVTVNGRHILVEK